MRASLHEARAGYSQVPVSPQYPEQHDEFAEPDGPQALPLGMQGFWQTKLRSVSLTPSQTQ